MKKYFYSAIAASMLFACSQEEIVDVTGGESQVKTFKVEIPKLESRTVGGIEIGKGTQANTLIYAMYENDEDPNTPEETTPLITGVVTDEGSDGVDNGEFIVKVPMAKDLKYDLLFFAYNAANSAFEIASEAKDTDLKNLKFKANQTANIDAFDAFVGSLKAQGVNDPNTVDLKRPFAQINAATTEADLDNATTLKLNVTKSNLVIKGVPQYYDVLNATASGSVDVTYAASPIMKCDDAATNNQKYPNEMIEVDGTNYYYLTLAYVLAGEVTTTSTHNATFEFQRENGQSVSTLEIVSLPIQRNFRTNVIGDLLTKNEEYTIKIDAEFGGKHIVKDPESAITNTVATVDELQAAIDAATGPTIIKFEQDINATSSRATSTVNINIKQKAGVDLLIDGCGYKFDGVMTVNGDGRSTGKETLKFTNINFSTSSVEKLTFINAPSKMPTEDGKEKYNYSHNVTIEGCTFEYTGNDGTEIGSASFTGTYNFVMKNCTATNMHSILQVQSCDNTAVVDNIKTINCKNGVSFGNTAYPTISNSEINSKEYGIRGDGDASRGNLVVKNTTINSKKPIIIRKVITNGYSVTLDENTKLITDELYAVVFTKNSDDVEYVAPETDYSIEGADNYNVHPMEEGTPVKASSDGQVASAINGGITTINLTEGTFIIPDVAQGKTLTFIGTGNPEDTKIATQDDGSYEGCDYSLDGATVTFENISINTDSQTYTGYARCNGTYKNCIINGTYTLYGNSTFENCTFNVSGDVYNIWTWGAPEATFTNCTFNCDGKAMLLYGTENTKLTMNNCTFNDNGGLSDLKAAIEIGNDYNKSYELIVNKATVNGFEINDKGINTGTTLWANKNSMGTDKLSVTIDGVKVY